MSHPSPAKPGRSLPGLLTPEAVLHRAAEDLARDFAGVVGVETVERLVAESYTGLRRTARVDAHLPVLAARFARERLTALGQSRGVLPKDRPEVLFVCVQNAGRSQLAAALTTSLSGGRVHVRSAGSQPATDVDPVVLQLIHQIAPAPAADAAEHDTDVFPKPLTDDVVRAADVVITMGCGDACPVYPGKRYEDWDVADPAGQDPTTVAAVRDDIEIRVQQLLRELLGDTDRTTTSTAAASEAQK